MPSPILVALLLGAAASLPADQLAGTAAGRPTPARPDLSWAEADALAQKLADAERRMREGKAPSPVTVLVTEGELNSYLNLSLGPLGKLLDD